MDISNLLYLVKRCYISKAKLAFSYNLKLSLFFFNIPSMGIVRFIDHSFTDN